ncbi:tyrosine-type recombinase/integrase [Thalassoglobus polymorphus]|uniref:Tyrosine recombinase XerC n=1 Tax=Thalassoglobus polymorphus TaxID=2527994 RepID=A0A517QR22_9PLAN|nr:site-specific integrase [Thalassoglobus polymorphus]QDT34081.1 Tyrosine recombinase XerC [Thalassoglobus polymorphus]
MRQPKKCHHKASDRAYVKINGQRIYLGKWNSQEADDAYDRQILKWRKAKDSSQELTTTVGELCLAFMEHAEEFYRDDAGNQTGEANNYRYALRPLIKLFRNVKCYQFGPSKLIEVRDELAAVHVRQQVNNNLARIKRVFKWGVSQELIPVSVFAALQTVEGLKRSRSKAKESQPVLPVPIDDFNKTLPYLTEPLSRMVQFQILTGARPSEARLLKVGDINTEGEVWLYKPNSHKNKWRGKARIICIGPKAQAVIMPFVEDAVSGAQYVFTPSDSSNQPYSLHGMISSISKACRKAKVESWSPGRLRHNAATSINQAFGDLDASRVVLGHAEKTTTEIYAERDIQKAIEIAKQIG